VLASIDKNKVTYKSIDPDEPDVAVIDDAEYERLEHIADDATERMIAQINDVIESEWMHAIDLASKGEK